MRRNIFIFFALFVLAGTSFVFGAFIAEKRTNDNLKKLVENKIQEKESQIINQKSRPFVEIVEGENQEVTESQKNQKEEETSKFSFAILGDTQHFNNSEKTEGFQKAVSNIKKMDVGLIFAIGDLISSCDGGSECEREYNNWKSVLGDYIQKTYVVQGNHDRTEEEKSDAIWRKVFNYLPKNGPDGFVGLTYSFDFENSHFVVLTSEKPEESLINDVQRNWLKKDLENNKKENIFVFFHEPAYPTNSKIEEGLDKNPKDRDALWSILENKKVTAVFSGHEHIQSRRKVNGIYQFVFGNTDSFNHLAPKLGMAEYYHIGQGFGIVEVNGKEVVVKTFSNDGKILDNFFLKK